MLPAQVLQELIRRLGASRLYVLVALPDAGDGLLIVLPLPIEVRRQCLVESFGRGCSAPPCEILEFGEPFRPDRKCAHRFNGRRAVPCCQGSSISTLPQWLWLASPLDPIERTPRVLSQFTTNPDTVPRQAAA